MLIEVSQFLDDLLRYVHVLSSMQTQPASSKLRPEAIWQKVCITSLHGCQRADIYPLSLSPQTESKEAYLDYLSQCKLEGLVTFIRTFVRTRI